MLTVGTKLQSIVLIIWLKFKIKGSCHIVRALRGKNRVHNDRNDSLKLRFVFLLPSVWQGLYLFSRVDFSFILWICSSLIFSYIQISLKAFLKEISNWETYRGCHWWAGTKYTYCLAVTGYNIFWVSVPEQESRLESQLFPLLFQYCQWVFLSRSMMGSNWCNTA